MHTTKGINQPYFFTPVPHELFERTSHFVHVKVRRPLSTPSVFLAG
jgi:hypothetical protein